MYQNLEFALTLNLQSKTENKSQPNEYGLRIKVVCRLKFL